MSGKDWLLLLKDIFAIALLVFAANACVLCETSEFFSDQYGNPVPKDVVTRCVESYGSQYGVDEFIQNISNIFPNESSYYTE